MYNVQSDQLYITVCLWYLVKSDLSIVQVHSSVQWKSHFLHVTEKHPHVNQVELYLYVFGRSVIAGNYMCFVL